MMASGWRLAGVLGSGARCLCASEVGGGTKEGEEEEEEERRWADRGDRYGAGALAGGNDNGGGAADGKGGSAGGDQATMRVSTGDDKPGGVMCVGWMEEGKEEDEEPLPLLSVARMCCRRGNRCSSSSAYAPPVSDNEGMRVPEAR